VQTIHGPVSLFVLIKGQRALGALLSSEQFNFGGTQLGRGYDVAEIIGDNGISGSVELRWLYTPNKFLVNSLEFYAFYDQGVMWDMTPIGELPTKQSAASAGAGVRFAVAKNFNGNFMWTQPITKQVVWFSVMADF
jgi:hemolysin activation/secretion protein